MGWVVISVYRGQPGRRTVVVMVREAMPGLAVCVAVAVPASVLGGSLPLVGGPVFAIFLGAAAGWLLRKYLPHNGFERLRPGFAMAGKQVLQASIVVLGTGLSLTQVVRVGGRSLPVMLGTVAVALGGAWLFGQLLRVGGQTGLLIGVGTAVCGASAIAATTAVVAVADDAVAYAIGTIFACNIAAVLLFPVVGHLLGLSQPAFGLFSGTAINDTSSVVAAAYGYGPVAGADAVVVKLTRTLLIVPICVGLRLLRGRTAGAGVVAAFPLFVLGFLAASTVDTLGLVPAAWHPGLAALGTSLVTVALAGIGASMRLGQLRAAGPRPLLLGVLLWLAVGATSLALQAVTGLL
jgi:uncharacterized integral membrane protein (TIGR00698 family)